MTRLMPFTGMSPPWPAPDTQLWHALAVELSLDSATLAKMLHQLGAPASLQGLVPVLDALPAVLDCARERELLDEQEHREWLAYHQYLTTRLQARMVLADFSKRFTLIGRDNVRNLCESHPYFAALLVLRRLGPTSPDLAPLLLRCWVAALRQYMTISADQHESIGRALRAVYDRQGTCPDLGLAAQPQLDDEAVAQALDESEPEGISVNRAHIEILCRLLRGEFKAASRRGGGGGEGGGGGGMRGGIRLQHTVTFDDIGRDPEMPESESSPTPCHRIDVRTRRPSGSEYETEARGLAPGDAGDSQTYASVPRNRTITLAENLDRLRQRVDKQAVAAEVAARAQPLGFRWEVLIPKELGVFFFELDQLLRQSAADAQDETRNLAVLLMTMLIRGQDPQEVFGCRFAVLNADDPEPEDARDVLIARLPKTRQRPAQATAAASWSAASWYWRTTPRLVTGGAPIGPDLVRSTSEVLRLPLPPRFAAFYADALGPACAVAPSGATNPLIHRPQRVLALLAGAGTSAGASPAARQRSWCSSVNRCHGTRLSAQRISRYFQRQAQARGALDGVSIATIRGRVDATSATPAYYQFVETASLALKLSACWEHLLEETLPEMAEDRIPSWLRRPGPEQRELQFAGIGPGVGSRRVPTPAAVRTVVSWLQKGITAARQPGSGWAAIVAGHNGYVLYTMHYLLWALGSRAIRDPVPDPRLIDQESQLVVLCDKSAHDRYSTRLVCAPDDFLAHLRLYHEHLQLLEQHLIMRHTHEHARLAASMQEWAGRSTTVDAAVPRLPSPFVEFDHDYRLVPLTSEAATVARMPRDLRLAANSSRHYLRTYLVEQGCPEDLIDAQLGHWYHGREPWGASSSLSPQSFARKMRQYTKNLTRELGFRPIKSPLIARRGRS